MKRMPTKPLSLASAWLCAVVCLINTSAGAAPADRVVEMDLTQLRAALDSGALTSVELVKAYLQRIEAIDRPASGLHAVLAINEQALEQARQWDMELAQQGGPRPSAALAGIPFLVKDNIDTVGLPTTGGSLVLAQSMPQQNAFVVQKLLDQGAILLGKTNLSELAASYGWYGYSSVGGQTLNPFNPLRTADGSSSGSAAAVAAKLAPFALGTDTTGSIRSPASVTGTVGMRSSRGLVSRAGVIPMSLTADVVGAITRNVQDQAIVLDAIAGEDRNDAATQGTARPQTTLAKGLENSSLTGKVIAVLDNFDGANPEVDAIKNSAVATLQKAGARVVKVRLPAAFETLQSAVLGPIGLAEFRPQFEAYLATLQLGQPKSLGEFMNRLEALTDHGSRLINPGRYKGLQENLATLSTDSPEYIERLSVVIPSLRLELQELMEAGPFDALLFATLSCTAPVVPGQSDPSFVCKGYPYAAAKIASTTGFPEVTVKGGVAAGHLPVGVSFLGRAGQDAQVLGLAAAFERAR